MGTSLISQPNAAEIKRPGRKLMGRKEKTETDL
jgi:hypothetical protein